VKTGVALTNQVSGLQEERVTLPAASELALPEVWMTTSDLLLP
jgi:hypothetical protein